MAARDWRDSREYRRWQDAVVAGGGGCVVPGCGSTKDLEAHHGNHASFFSEDRFVVKKGRKVCGRCHGQYHNNYHSSTKQKCTLKDWDNFISLMQYAHSLHMFLDKKPGEGA